MENLSAFVWGVVVTLGIVAVIGLLWHLWQHHQQAAQPPAPQQPAQAQPQIPPYIHGVNAAIQGVLQIIQQTLQGVQNPTRVRVTSSRIAAFNDHIEVTPVSVDVQAGQGGN
jgi:cytochrome c-type biogenesis protein CcmH/NrfG